MLTIEAIEGYREGRRSELPARWDYDRGWVTLEGCRLVRSADVGYVVEAWLYASQPEVSEAAIEQLSQFPSDTVALVLYRWYCDTNNKWSEV